MIMMLVLWAIHFKTHYQVLPSAGQMCLAVIL